MFSDLYDYVSLFFYRHWPSVEGEITAVRILGGSGRLLVEYSFSLAGGSYIGESGCPWSVDTAAVNIHQRLSVGRSVTVRYRPDNPTVNKLDRSVWEDLEGL
jgi:hypothetical protein